MFTKKRAPTPKSSSSEANIPEYRRQVAIILASMRKLVGDHAVL